MEELRYEDIRNPALPWGYWLSAEEHGLVDEQGQKWTSIRHCFWADRLGLPKEAGSAIRDLQLEFLLAVLVANDRQIVSTEERTSDLFRGRWEENQFYACWLHGRGLLRTEQYSRRVSLEEKLTPEGRAVILMLAATRAPDAVALPIGLPTLRQWLGLDGGKDREELERVMAASEAHAARLPYRFVSREIGGNPAVILLGEALGLNIPIRRTLWSMTFIDPYARVRMYLWLHARIDRWPEWGWMAWRFGAQALSDHLLQLQLCDKPAERPG